MIKNLFFYFFEISIVPCNYCTMAVLILLQVQCRYPHIVPRLFSNSFESIKWNNTYYQIKINTIHQYVKMRDTKLYARPLGATTSDHTYKCTKNYNLIPWLVRHEQPSNARYLWEFAYYSMNKLCTSHFYITSTWLVSVYRAF